MRNLLLLMTLFAGLSSFLIFWENDPSLFVQSKNLTPEEALPIADIYMKATESVQFSKDGFREYQLTTQQSEFFEDQDRWQTQMPHLIAYDKDNKDHPWELKAEQGQLLEKGSKIVMRENVMGWQFTGIDKKNEITTTEITIFPNERVIETDQAVSFVATGAVMSGVGLWANLTTGKYRLLSNVRGKFDAP